MTVWIVIESGTFNVKMHPWFREPTIRGVYRTKEEARKWVEKRELPHWFSIHRRIVK